jgi:DNA topoisomerase-1
LIVAEKPTAAERLAKALDEKGTPRRVQERGVPYFIAESDRKIVVVSALGHLYTVGQKKGTKSRYPVFDFVWAPRYLVEKGAQRTKAWIAVISELASDADVFIDACDYDIEGSLIGYNILHHACGKAEAARRMKYSTLTKAELEAAYEHPLPTLDFNLIQAGKTRHELDWLYGINLSRALTSAIKRAKRNYATLSTGRVQGPTLRFLAVREDSIACFVPTPYWTLKAHVEIQGKLFEADYVKKTIGTRVDADAIVEACDGTLGRISEITQTTFRGPPPVPFDIGTLQNEAYRFFGYPPRQTANLAERLYLDALISYPRTSSQKLPPTIGYRSILAGLSKEPAYEDLASKLLALATLKPREGKKADPAHPAIYPTGNLPERKLTAAERKIRDVIVKRFMAAFSESAVKQKVRLEVNVNGHRFFLSGRKVLKEGWMHFYRPYVRFNEVLLPDAKKGEEVGIQRILCEERFVKPPPRYNAGSLLKKMEKEGIGTKATRADIIHTLFDRKYIAGSSIRVTALGQCIIEILQEFCPAIVSVKLTREIEEKMLNIQNNKETHESILAHVISRLEPVLEGLKSREQAIGEALSDAVGKARLQERTIGNCPTCKTGKLVILRSRKTGKRFIGCTNYFENSCKTAFPLPQTGTVKPTGRTCTSCGWPTLVVFRKRRRRWTLCLNPACPGKKERK